ncbi:rod shape-determining protein MreC [Clostridium neuense]|uniref:Cell shape-determining protein MreC n=1 Tax=Clostridium neuense TaxID=1728934 RepID=A0ABW8TLH0_9CLOT
MKVFKNKLTVTIVVLSVSFLILIAYSFKRNSASFVENGVGTTLNTVEGFFYKINDNIKDFLGFVVNFSSVKSENATLKEKNSELRKKALLYDSLKKENDDLKKQLNFETDKSEFKYVGCEILHKSGGNILKSYVISRGSKDGIAKGMAVLNADGLIGIVTSVNASYSTVETICNESTAVAASINRTGDNSGVLKGYVDSDNENLAQLTMLPLDADIKKGDIILTSGVGGYYPKNIMIGKVIDVEPNASKGEKQAIVKPAVDFDKLERVSVVVPKNNRGEIKYDN